MSVNYGVFGNLTEMLRLFCECGNSILQNKGFFFVLLVHFAIWVFLLICTEISRTKVSFFITENDYRFREEKSTYRMILYISPLPVFFIVRLLVGDSWVFIAPLVLALILRVELLVQVQLAHARVRKDDRIKASAKDRTLDFIQKSLNELKTLGIDLSLVVDSSPNSIYWTGFGYDYKGSKYLIWIVGKLEELKIDVQERERLIKRLADLSSQSTDYDSFDKGFNSLYDDYKFWSRGRKNGSNLTHYDRRYEGKYADEEQHQSSETDTHWHELPPEEKKSSFWDEWDEMCQRERQRQEDFNKQMDDLAYYAAMDKARE